MKWLVDHFSLVFISLSLGLKFDLFNRVPGNFFGKTFGFSFFTFLSGDQMPSAVIHKFERDF